MPYCVMKIGRLPLLPYHRPGDHAAEELEETATLFLLLQGAPTRPLDAAQISELKTTFKLAV
jgi:hypothetical protein